jgi:hypothetical protein
MGDIMADAFAILLACLVIAGFASALILLRPSARRRRRHRRHTRRPRIDLFETQPAEQAGSPDA